MLECFKIFWSREFCLFQVVTKETKFLDPESIPDDSLNDWEGRGTVRCCTL